MKIAIVGSRNFGDMGLVREYIMNIPVDDTIVSGGAPGVDTVAEQTALGTGHSVMVFQANWKAHGKVAGFLRNQSIVDASDAVAAFWDGESKGTHDTIKKALKAKKNLVVFFSR